MYVAIMLQQRVVNWSCELDEPRVYSSGIYRLVLSCAAQVMYTCHKRLHVYNMECVICFEIQNLWLYIEVMFWLETHLDKWNHVYTKGKGREKYKLPSVTNLFS